MKIDPPTRSVVLVIVWSILFANTSLLQAQKKNDLVWRRAPGAMTAEMVSGKIESASPDFLKLKTAKGTEQIAIDTITKVMPLDDPAGFAAVRSSVQGGQLEQALAQVKSVKPSGRDFVRHDVAFHKAMIRAKLAMQGTGTVNDAAGAVSSFLKTHRDSFRYYEACELMGDLAMSLGRFDGAAKFYGKLGASQSKALAARGKLLQGDASLLQGDATKASALYKLAATSDDTRLQSLGRVGLAACQAKDGNADEAISQLEQIIKRNESSDVELFGRTYNALGQAYQLAGKTEAALDAYLHTDLLFYRHQPTHAEALFHLSKLWSQVNKPAEARRAKETLKQRYASSLWAKK